MGLIAAARRLATSRPHLLLLEEPSGGVSARVAVERWARLQGWPLVDSPADADILVVAGPPTGLGPYADRVWDQLPGPRSRVHVTDGQDVPTLLEQARRHLADLDRQRRDVRRVERPGATAPASDSHAGHDMSAPQPDPHTGHDMSAPQPDPHAGHDMSAPQPDPHAGHDMSGHDMSGHDMSGPQPDPHAGHDMGGMAMPAGLAMADRAADRDGLKLDALTVPWGPALPWWPAGLVLTTTLQGDVIQTAEVTQLGDPDARRDGWLAVTAYLSPSHAAATVRLDALARLLAVAGWEAAHVACQRLRDDLLAGTAPATVSPGLRRLARRVGRSRPLARMTAGIATTHGEDVTRRYRRWLAEAVSALDAGTGPTAAAPADAPADAAAAALPALVVGTEVATARLLVASLDLELSRAAEWAVDRV